MSLLSPRLQLKVSQKQIPYPRPGLQMVTVLQLNRLELKEMINQEIVENPVLEEATEDSARGRSRREELMPLLEGPGAGRARPTRSPPGEAPTVIHGSDGAVEIAAAEYLRRS